ncbi:MAG: DUF1207 domain-containing protein [Deltaproteobacteria bacterium]|nr:DUF1207 domain-containing protein [Deltaproteobacteria bacterium]
MMHHYSLFLRGLLGLARLFIGLTLIFCQVPTSWAARATDEFIQGYATAVVAMSYPAGVQSIRVNEGMVFLTASSLSNEDKRALREALREVEGVSRVVFVQPESGSHGVTLSSEVKLKDGYLDEYLPVFLPETQLFRPLIADPRWPNFSASYQRYIKGDLLKDVGSVSFGETFSIYRFRGPWESTMEVGIQAGVFSIFDLNAESHDLINADYRLGLPVTISSGNFTNMTRVFHQSSHLGDEYLLRGNVTDRQNLSYEGVDTLFSYDLPKGFRVYGGGGYLFHRTPSEFEPWYTQAGMEFYSPWYWLKGAVRPIAAVDVQNWQENGWNADLSVRGGIQFGNPDFLGRKLMLLLEYYNGKSPNGQFYEKTIEYVGLGLHFFFE